MFSQFIKRAVLNETISMARYAKDHATMTNKQLDMIRDHLNAQLGTMRWQIVLSNQMVLAGFAGVGYLFHLEKEHNDRKFEQVDKQFDQVDKRFEQVDKQLGDVKSELNEIKALVIQSLNRN